MLHLYWNSILWSMVLAASCDESASVAAMVKTEGRPNTVRSKEDTKSDWSKVLPFSMALSGPAKSQAWTEYLLRDLKMEVHRNSVISLSLRICQEKLLKLSKLQLLPKVLLQVMNYGPEYLSKWQISVFDLNTFAIISNFKKNLLLLYDYELLCVELSHKKCN